VESEYCKSPRLLSGVEVLGNVKQAEDLIIEHLEIIITKWNEVHGS